MIEIEPLMEDSQKVYKSKLPEQTKEFMLFVLAQIMSLDIRNKEKFVANSKTGKLEKLKEWHEGGSIYYEMPIKNGLKNGEFQMWQVNGKIMCQIPFENNVINGTVFLYKSDGIEEVQFKDGYPILLDK